MVLQHTRAMCMFNLYFLHSQLQLVVLDIFYPEVWYKVEVSPNTWFSRLPQLYMGVWILNQSRASFLDSRNVREKNNNTNLN